MNCFETFMNQCVTVRDLIVVLIILIFVNVIFRDW